MTILKMCLFLEREHDLRPGGRSWAALGGYVGGLGPLLVPMLVALVSPAPSAGLGGLWAKPPFTPQIAP